MKNTKNFFITLAICVVLSMAASVTTTKMIVEPAKPVSVVTIWCDGNEAQSKIKQYSSQGYVVKTLTMTHYYAGSMFIVMEKY